jgi:hypothetical protein
MSQEQSIDERSVPYLVEWAQRVSRRGLLARVGQVAMKIAGISLVPLLPVDRAFAQFACGSGDWQTCGMHGFFCKSCCGGGPSYASCPPCTYTGSFWTGCCQPPDVCASKVLIRYYDCCGTRGEFSDEAAQACRGDECPPGGGSGSPAYCQFLGNMRCTVVVNTGMGCS